MPKHEVKDFVDVLYVQTLTKRFAATLGFSSRECGELAIVASELSSNILKYGRFGTMEFGRYEDRERGLGMSIVAEDHGPPFQNLEMALLDGWDDKGPLDPRSLWGRHGTGSGLGAVVRLTDEFGCEQNEQGKRIRVIRYLKRPRRFSVRP